MKNIFDKLFKKKEKPLVNIANSLAFPRTILIDTVSCCNLKCSMCFHSKMKRQKGFMKWELFEKIIDEVAIENKDARVWMVYFGDPFVRARKKPTIFDMIKYAKSKGLTNVVANTNGCLMNEENARKTIESGLDEIFIGIDAFNDKTYSENRVGGNYQETVDNVLRLIELKKELKSETPKVYVQFVEMSNNIDQKQDFIDFWSKVGAGIKIRPMITWGGKIDRTDTMIEPSDRTYCYWGMDTASIIDTGDIVTCAVDLDGEHSFGNVYTNSIKNIWNSTMREFRQNHLDKKWDELHDLCRNCNDWYGPDGDTTYAPYALIKE